MFIEASPNGYITLRLTIIYHLVTVSLQFQPPVPPESWGDTIRNAIEIPPACPQPTEGVAYIEYHVPGFNRTSEDCLFLNIYLPKVSITFMTEPQQVRQNAELYKPRRWLEAGNCRFTNKNCTFRVAKTKALISVAVTAFCTKTNILYTVMWQQHFVYICMRIC